MKKVIITGATSGIGFAFANILLKSGYEVYITGRTGEKCTRTIEQLEEQTGRKCAGFCEADLSKGEDLLRVCGFVRNVKPNMLINNAGFGLSGEVRQIEDTEAMNMINVNVKALTLISATVSRIMQQGDTIINVASLAAFGPNSYSATYSATKAYVMSFSMALADELKKYGITVTCLCPGPTETLFGKKSKMDETKVFDGHVMTAQEVAECGLKAAKKGKLYVVAGKSNAFLARMERIMPYKTVLSISGSMLTTKK